MARNTRTDSAVVDTRPEVARLCALANSATPSIRDPRNVSSLRSAAIVHSLPLPAHHTASAPRSDAHHSPDFRSECVQPATALAYNPARVDDVRAAGRRGAGVPPAEARLGIGARHGRSRR